MERSGAWLRLVVRGLALLGALVALSAFHSSASEPVGAARPVAVATDLVGPLHVDLNDIPSVVPDEDYHAHLFVVFLFGGLLLAFAVRPLAYAVGDLWPTTLRRGATDPPRPTTPSLTSLCVLRT
ncbi:hypothetical protein ACQHIV_11255 [Kribbella sp. GL6]|uniref:hypothetical protein n=1 Tax=Kribbella sp. GL6 TaxID=3419765 RepID=UPI003D07C1A6